MHCRCSINNRAPRWTFTDSCKPEVRPGVREESASPAWLAASAMNARDTTKVYIWRLGTGCGPTLYRKCQSHNIPGKGIITLEPNPNDIDLCDKNSFFQTLLPPGAYCFTNTCIFLVNCSNVLTCTSQFILYDLRFIF